SIKRTRNSVTWCSARTLRSARPCNAASRRARMLPVDSIPRARRAYGISMSYCVRHCAAQCSPTEVTDTIDATSPSAEVFPVTRMFPDEHLTPFAGDTGTPVSEKIRERLRQANQRFHANDNISAYIEDGELAQLQMEVEEKMRGVLDSLVIDTE